MSDSSFDLLPARFCQINRTTSTTTSTTILGFVDDAALALSKQWPRGGTALEYKRKLLGYDENIVDVDKNLGTTNNLPCSYLLIHNGRFVGHGRLTECFEGCGGNAVAATYIITEPRGLGYGTILMKLLEQETVRLGYHYVYLWTTTALTFYKKMGYTRTERVSLHSACLKKLETQQVGALEAMLGKRNQAISSATRETVTLPPGTSSNENDVWLRKRLVENLLSTQIPFDIRINELQLAVKQHTTKTLINDWKYFYHDIPWQQQIGPSCGLATLRMLREYYYCDCIDITVQQQNPSLLFQAQTKGFTVDGEIFDIENMIHLADYCGLKTTLRQFQSLSARDMLHMIMKERCTIILPYDSHPYNKQPFANGGKSAHYGIVVGMLVGCSARKECSVEFSDCCNEITPTISEISTLEKMYANHTETTEIVTLLLVQHGLSSNWSIASYDEFRASNQQLKEIDSSKYRLPDRGNYNLSDSILICHGKG